MPVVAVQQYSKGSLRTGSTVEHETQTIAAPTGGLNSSASVIGLSPTDSLLCENFITRQFGLELRSGYLKWQDNLGDPARTIAEFHDRDPVNDKLFAFTEVGIFDVTLRLENVTPATPDVTFGFQQALASDIWSHTNFSTNFVSYLCVCSAGNGYYTYDDAGGWVQHVAGVGAGDIDGTDPVDFDYILEWKRRLWFVKAGETSAWYLPVNQIAGEVREFDFGPFLAHGGSIAAMISWTRDGGNGADDYLVITGTEGDVVLYQGTDPNQSVSFGLSGAWYVGGFPVGRRFFENIGGDVQMLCSQGLVSLEVLMTGQNIDVASGLSYKIQEALTAEFRDRKDDFSWEVLYDSGNSIVILKVPAKASEDNWAYAAGIHSKGWSTLVNMPMVTLSKFGNDLFGSDETGVIYKLLSGNNDNVGFSGSEGVSEIAAQLQTSFLPVGGGNDLKIPQLVASVFLAESAPSVNTNVNTEFNFAGATAPAFQQLQGQFLWDTALWDVAYWVGSSRTFETIHGVEGMGHFMSLRMAVKGKAGTVFTHWRVIYKSGGIM